VGLRPRARALRWLNDRADGSRHGAST